MEKLKKKDLSGKSLFLLGIILIGISIFNLFEDPIVNGYYRIKRNFERQITLPAIITTPTTNVLTKETSIEEIPNPVETQGVISGELDISENEGFLPLNVEVSTTSNVTPEPTKASDVIPVRLEIPSIELEADIIHAQSKEIEQGDKTYIQWLAPDEYAVGWHFDSAFLGEPGNTVMNGHHNVFGKVFENLDKLTSGDEIIIYGNDSYQYTYVVSNSMIFPERDVTFEKRLENARWILPSEDERITLITCWPYFSNTHRLIIVARPVEAKPILIPIERE
jgi:LPXTG-site transpeptidase (sortase) family protein